MPRADGKATAGRSSGRQVTNIHQRLADELAAVMVEQAADPNGRRDSGCTDVTPETARLLRSAVRRQAKSVALERGVLRTMYKAEHQSFWVYWDPQYTPEERDALPRTSAASDAVMAILAGAQRDARKRSMRGES